MGDRIGPEQRSVVIDCRRDHPRFGYGLLVMRDVYFVNCSGVYGQCFLSLVQKPWWRVDC
jgi:hypothetical protein